MNRVYKIVWSKAKNAYVVTSELAKNHTRSASGKAVKAALTVAVGMGVLMGGYAADAAAKDIVDKGGNLIAYDISPANEGTNIAVGKNAKVFIGGGTQESMLSFGETIEHTLTGMHIHSNNAAKQNLPAGMAVGTNTYARTGSIQMGDHTLEKNQIAIGDTTADKLRQFGVASTTLGTNSYTGGGFATTIGSYNVQSSQYEAKDFWDTLDNSTKNAFSTVVGTLNSNESMTGSSSSGVTNVINGTANKVTNSNGAIVMGAGNSIKNSSASINTSAYSTNYASVAAMQKALMDGVARSAGGSTLAIGGANAAESLGCSRMGRIWKIIVPLVMPTLLASSMLVFMRVFADFGTPMLIGEGYKTLPVLIYNQFMGEVSGDDGFAAAICCIVIGLTIVMFFVQRFLAGRNTYAMTALKPMAAESLGGLRNILAHLAVYMTVGLAILPQFVVVYTSFLATNGGQVFTGGFALQSYDATLFAKDNDVIWHTYFLGLCAIAAVLVLGVLIAYLSVRKRNTLNSILDVITMFPFIIPGSVLGIAFVFAFNKSPIILTGTALIMIISFAVRRMPYTVRSSTAILGNISSSIEEAAISLGASDMTTFRKITVPMMMPGVLSGAIMSWVTIISELSSSIILYTNSTQTLTVSIYTEVIRGNYGNASAYATILTVTSILSLLLFYKVTGRRDVSV